MKDTINEASESGNGSAESIIKNYIYQTMLKEVGERDFFILRLRKNDSKFTQLKKAMVYAAGENYLSAKPNTMNFFIFFKGNVEHAKIERALGGLDGVIDSIVEFKYAFSSGDPQPPETTFFCGKYTVDID